MKLGAIPHFFLMFVLAACSDVSREAMSDNEVVPVEEEEQSEEEAAEELEELTDELAKELGDVAEVAQELLGALSNPSIGDVPDDPEYMEGLERLLPRKVAGIDAVTKHSHVHRIGFGMAEVSATYVDDHADFTIDIMDLASLAPLVSNFNEWVGAEIDSESDRGFERTRRYRHGSKEYPGLEVFARTNDHAECSVVVWVADRFLVTIKGSGNEIEMSDCTEAREALSFRRMERFAEKLQDI